MSDQIRKIGLKGDLGAALKVSVGPKWEPIALLWLYGGHSKKKKFQRHNSNVKI